MFRVTVLLLFLLMPELFAIQFSPLFKINDATSRVRNEASNNGYLLYLEDETVITVNNRTELENHLNAGGIRAVFPSKLHIPTSDSMLVLSNTNDVHSGNELTTQYKGKGVIIGIIDKGFDYTHPAFRWSDSTTRIIRAWNQRDSSGSSPDSFGYGTEHKNQEELFNAKYDGYDLGSHGTNVSSIAAGSIIEGVPYHGVAPETELIFVTTTYQSNHIIDAIDYIFSIAELENKPAAINMSLASAFGPHDGTSPEDRGIGQHADRGVIVNAAGNSGFKKQHILFNLTGKDSAKTLTTLPWRNQMMDFWGEPLQRFEIQLTVVDSSMNVLHTLPAISTLNEYFDTTVTILDTVEIRIQLASAAISEINNKPEIIVAYDVSTGDIYDTHNVILSITGTRGTVHGWNSAYTHFNSFDKPGFTDGDYNYTLGESGGTCKETIAVGAFTSKRRHQNIWGEEFVFNAEDTSQHGGIAFFSAKGPTIDGRDKPDIAAPGYEVVAGEGHHKLDQDSARLVMYYEYMGEKYPFVSRHGTSQSTPVATGAAALLLQVDPTLTTAEVRNILRSTATTDSFTIEEYRWGGGKINIDAAVKSIAEAGPSAISTAHKNIEMSAINRQNEISIYNPKRSEVTVTIYSIAGRNLKEITSTEKDIIVNLNALGSGIYVAELTLNQNRIASQKMCVQ